MIHRSAPLQWRIMILERHFRAGKDPARSGALQ